MLDKDIHYKEEVVSTNSYLKELIESQQLSDGYTIYAGFQTSGRGQRGNTWESEHRLNLTCSILLKPQFVQVKDSFLLSQIVSLAVSDILNLYADHITIKWPNDIYWKDKKIAGVLIENSFIDDVVVHSIVGIGLNLNQQCFESDAPNPISLKQITGNHYDVLKILSLILKRLSFYYEMIREEGDFEYIRNVYKKALYRKEGFYTFSDQQGIFSARIKDIADLGLLILETDNNEVRNYGFKEVKYIL